MKEWKNFFNNDVITNILNGMNFICLRERSVIRKCEINININLEI